MMYSVEDNVVQSQSLALQDDTLQVGHQECAQQAQRRSPKFQIRNIFLV